MEGPRRGIGALEGKSTMRNLALHTKQTTQASMRPCIRVAVTAILVPLYSETEF